MSAQQSPGRRRSSALPLSLRDKATLLFAQLDTNQSGSIELPELERVVAGVGFTATDAPDAAQSIFAMLDVDHDGVISLDDFIRALENGLFDGVFQAIAEQFNADLTPDAFARSSSNPSVEPVAESTTENPPLQTKISRSSLLAPGDALGRRSSQVAFRFSEQDRAAIREDEEVFETEGVQPLHSPYSPMVRQRRITAALIRASESIDDEEFGVDAPRRKLSAIFKAAAGSATGRISLSELVEVLKDPALAQMNTASLSIDHVQRVMEAMSADKNGQLSLDEFCDAFEHVFISATRSLLGKRRLSFMTANTIAYSQEVASLNITIETLQQQNSELLAELKKIKLLRKSSLKEITENAQTDIDSLQLATKRLQAENARLNRELTHANAKIADLQADSTEANPAGVDVTALVQNADDDLLEELRRALSQRDEELQGSKALSSSLQEANFLQAQKQAALQAQLLSARDELSRSPQKSVDEDPIVNDLTSIQDLKYLLLEERDAKNKVLSELAHFKQMTAEAWMEHQSRLQELQASHEDSLKTAEEHSTRLRELHEAKALGAKLALQLQHKHDELDLLRKQSALTDDAIPSIGLEQALLTQKQQYELEKAAHEALQVQARAVEAERDRLQQDLKAAVNTKREADEQHDLIVEKLRDDVLLLTRRRSMDQSRTQSEDASTTDANTITLAKQLEETIRVVHEELAVMTAKKNSEIADLQQEKKLVEQLFQKLHMLMIAVLADCHRFINSRDPLPEFQLLNSDKSLNLDAAEDSIGVFKTFARSISLALETFHSTTTRLENKHRELEHYHERQLAVDRQQHDSLVTSMLHDHETAIAQHDAAILQAVEEARALRDQIKTLSSDRTALEQRVTQLTQELTQKDESMGARSSGLRKQSVGNRRDALKHNTRNDSMTEVLKLIEDKSTTVAQLQKQIQALQSSYDSEIEHLTARIEELQNVNDTMSNEVVVLRSQLAEIEFLKRTNDELREQNMELKTHAPLSPASSVHKEFLDAAASAEASPANKARNRLSLVEVQEQANDVLLPLFQEPGFLIPKGTADVVRQRMARLITTIREGLMVELQVIQRAKQSTKQNQELVEKHVVAVNALQKQNRALIISQQNAQLALANNEVFLKSKLKQTEMEFQLLLSAKASEITALRAQLEARDLEARALGDRPDPTSPLKRSGSSARAEPLADPLRPSEEMIV
eukprot:m.591422 g.591422  ORF g.591422 m.591422 type:complete len:1197 (+) comp58015_c0_seq3:85-3675(+)